MSLLLRLLRSDAPQIKVGGGPALSDTVRNQRRRSQQQALAADLMRQAQDRLATKESAPEKRIAAAKSALKVISPVIDDEDEAEYEALLAMTAWIEKEAEARTRLQNQLAALQLMNEINPFLNNMRARLADDEEAAIMVLLLAA